MTATTTTTTERPFPFDTATGIKDGAIVYFGWQAHLKLHSTGDTVCISGRTKSVVIRTMVELGWDPDEIDLDRIVPIALTAPAAITTKSAGRFSPLDFETAETVDKAVKAVKKKAPPPTAVEDEDDLI